MKILPYEPEMLEAVTAAYNDFVRDAPYGYPVSRETMASALEGAVGGKGAEGMHSEAAFVARRAGRMLGLAHVGVGLPRGGKGEPYGVIRFFCYERGEREAGQDLLAAAEECLRGHDVRRIATFDQHHRYPFYHLSHAYLSERHDHVEALLGINGYRRAKGEVTLEWRDYTPPDPGRAPVACEVTVEWSPGGGRLPDLCIRALRDGEQIGVCECESVGQHTEAEEAQAWFLTAWLGIEGEWQGKGLGRYLLQRALGEMHGAGYRHAAISTDWHNYRAALFYANYGYQVSDWTYIHERET